MKSYQFDDQTVSRFLMDVAEESWGNHLHQWNRYRIDDKKMDASEELMAEAQDAYIKHDPDFVKCGCQC